MNVLWIAGGFIIMFIVISIILLILKKMKGSIKIIPEKYNYSQGETVNGQVILKLKKPVAGAQMIVGLKCERKDVNRADVKNKQNTSEKIVFDFNQPLEGIKDYSHSEYSFNFSIVIPQNTAPKLEGIAGTLAKTALIFSDKQSIIKWYVYAELKCKGINLSKEVQLNIT